MSEKKDQLEDVLKDQFYREAKQVEEEVGLNDGMEEIPEELKARMKLALDQKIREYEATAKATEATEAADVYAGLSEEDKEALRLGREMLKQQDEDKKVRTVRRKKRTIRRLAALAAVLILVMALGMTSFGGPERVLQFVKSSVGNRQVSKVNSSDKNKIIEEEDEEKAYQLVDDEFGVETVQLMWRPDGMEFEKMELDTDIQVAELDYLYNGERTEFMISASYGEVSWGYDNEDEKINQYYYDKVKEAKIEITEFQTPKTETNRYVAEFEYKKVHYCLSGTMTQEEMEKILNNLYFL